jgi:hypothetical protein
MKTPRSEILRLIKTQIPEESPLSITALDPDLRILWVNAAMAREWEVPADRWVGRRLSDMVPGLEAGQVEPMLRHILETGEHVVDVEQQGPPLRDTETNRVWNCSGLRLYDADGGVLGVAVIAVEVTRRIQDRDRLALLNEASEKIGSTLKITRTAEETLDVLVPRIGDCANVSLLSYVLDGGPQPSTEPRTGSGADYVSTRIVATRWLPGVPVPESLWKGAVANFDASSLYYRRLAEGRPMFAPRMADPSGEYRELFRSDWFRLRMEAAEAAGAHSAMVLPIGARGAILGTVAIYRMRQPPFSVQDLELARDVLVRSALCLDNARVYSRERATALELQRSMLPQSLTETPGIELAYSYVPANTASEIGGDWFDVVRQPDGRVVLIVGDVSGHDIHAASLMGQIRTVTRTLATLDLSPVEVLTRLDAMVAEMGSEVGATCVYAAFDPDCRCCVIARAGHPPPVLVGPGGSVEFLEMPPGLPLGVGGGVFESVDLDVQPGSMLVLYTDGLIESREAAIDIGMGDLADALGAATAEPFGSQLAATLITRLVPDPEDDIVVLLGYVSGRGNEEPTASA